MANLSRFKDVFDDEFLNRLNTIVEYLNKMGYTYEESLRLARSILDEAKRTNNMNINVQEQINTLIAESGTSDAEVLQARIDADGNEYDVLKKRLDEKEQNFSAQLAENTKLIGNRGVDVSKLGAVADGTTNNTQIFRSALTLSKTLNLPIFIPKGEKSYLLDDFATLENSENVHIFSNGATISGKGFKLTNIKNVSVYGFHFKGSNLANSILDDALYFLDCERVNVSDNIIDSCFVRYRTTSPNKNTSGIKIINNFFIGDTSEVGEQSGANLIEIYGCKDVLIEGNSFATLNTYRTVKISSSLGVVGNVNNNGYTDVLRITNNYFGGSVKFKQVIDCYAGIDNLFIHDNFFETLGAMCLLETKIAGAGGDLTQSTLKEAKVYNNKIKIQDESMADLFRVFGYSFTNIDNGGPTSAFFSGNTVENTTNKDVSMLNVRGFTKAHISNNLYTSLERSHAGGFQVVACNAVGDLSINNNIFDVGHVGIYPTATTSNPDVSYNGSLKYLISTGNIFKDVRGYGGILIRSHDAIETISINGDIITGNTNMFTELLASIYIRDCTVETVSIQGVVFKIDDPVRNRVSYINCTIGKTMEFNNSWNV